MILIFLDFETTVVDPVDPSKMPPVELGAILFDTSTGKPIRMGSFLIWDNEDEAYNWTELAHKITGIELEHLLEFATHPKQALEYFVAHFLQKAVHIDTESGDPVERIVIVAHNGLRFDKIVFDTWVAKFKMTLPQPAQELLSIVHWVDSICDIQYPAELTTRKLSYMAAELGFVNPFPHRALPDTLTLMRVAQTFDIEDAYKRSLQEKVTCVADCRKPWQDPAPEGMKDTDFAKERGFKFDGSLKQWTKTVLASEVDAEKAACAPKFRVGTIRKDNTNA